MASVSNFIFSLPTSLFSQQQQQQQQNSNEADKSDENGFDIVSPPSMDESNIPITGICLVTKPEYVPTGYTCIRKAYDEPSKDADLMPNSVFERKDRFVCITRIYPLAGGLANVLEDIKMINERDPAPPGYEALTHTVDGREKATSKRTICVRLVERQAGIKCICDIIFLSRAKRPPQYYTIIGEINGLQMCVKEGTVPNFRPAPPVPGPHPDNRSSYASHRQPSSTDYSNTNTLTKKSDEKEILDGIPFQINSKYFSANRSNKNSPFDIDSFRILSPYEIEQIFYYDFHLEHSSLY